MDGMVAMQLTRFSMKPNYKSVHVSISSCTSGVPGVEAYPDASWNNDSTHLISFVSLVVMCYLLSVFAKCCLATHWLVKHRETSDSLWHSLLIQAIPRSIVQNVIASVSEFLASTMPRVAPVTAQETIVVLVRMMQR